MTARGFHPLTIDRVRPQTADARAIRFAVPEELADTFRFLPGQHLTLRATIDGEEVRRAYSICSGEREAPEVGIKRVEDGVFSTFAMALAPGDIVEAMAPEGRFIVTPGGRRDILLVAAGSGITPCLSIAKAVLEGEPESSVTLVYGNRSTASVMFREEIDALKDRFTGRFTLVHVMSREAQDIPFLNGRVDGERIRELVARGLVPVQALDAAYLCGPQPMIEGVSEALRDLGMDATAIHFELFATTTSPRRAVPAAETRPDATIAFVVDGSLREVPIDLAHQTALEAGRAAGLDLPFSCAGGMCCTCRAKVTKGEVEMDANYSLEPWEIEQGFALACQARPKGDGVVMDFDAA